MSPSTSNPIISKELFAIGGLLLAVLCGWLAWNSNVESASSSLNGYNPTEVIAIWPDSATDKRIDVGKEYDKTGAADELIAGGRVMRLTNVANAELHLFPAPEKVNNGAAVVICPGGGFSVLAWDLEGTEVAKWLNSLGVNAYVLKYRVPTRKLDFPAGAPTEDLQRAIALIRSNCKAWKIDPDRIGALGFSAGAIVAMRAGLSKDAYAKVDAVDDQSTIPNFLISIYGGRMLEEDGSLNNSLTLDVNSPPLFVVHAYDDFVPVQNSLGIASAYKKAGVSVEAHIYDAGGHGFGLRFVKEHPITSWPDRCEEWMRRNGWLEVSASEGK
jgi:acetyl esterase/lipase